MSHGRTERLVNLALCLMSSRRRLWTADEVRRTVPGYDEHPETPAGEAAFRRAFERDKDELRRLGFPLEVRESLTGVDGYRIPPQEAMLPDVSLDPDEARAVGLAVRMWRSGTLKHAAGRAWEKLHAAGVDDIHPDVPPGDHQDGTGLFQEVPVVDTGEPSFDPLLAALRDRYAVSFDYRRSGAPHAETREVEPWGMRAVRGRWYLVGFDRQRESSRVFRLSRISGGIRRVGPRGGAARPAGVNLSVGYDGEERSRTALVRLRQDRAHEVRRLADSVAPDPQRSGYDLARVPFGDVERAGAMVASHGADAVVLEPEDLREHVVALLSAQVVGS